ncbi:MAG: leucine-rich repeat protein [Clostridia bacterium]|nr:leucine-rich repeat protein [Clostridia bacterium]
MKLIERIKNLIIGKKKEQPKISSTDIVGYDTSLVYIPKYKELTEEEKAQVDRYVEETDTTKIENVILYGTDMNKYSKGITELLLNVAYRATEESATDRAGKLTTQDILNLRVDAMVAIEEMNYYETVLRNLEREATLRTVALEQIYKKEKGNFRTFGVFEKAERIRRQHEEERFEVAIERMRISKKIVEQQIQAVLNLRGSNDRLAHAINIYKSLLKDTDTENQSRAILEAKKQELLEMIKVIAPEKASNVKEGTDEESKIKEIARLQGMIEIYAYTHKENINQLRQRIAELDLVEKTDKNRDELLKELSDIRIKYKVFGRYIKDEDLENLYKVKFDVLMSDINKRKESPLLDLKEDDEEIQYYKRIIESKIEQILTLNNPEVERAFGEKKVREAVAIIRKLLKCGGKTFDIGRILQDKTLLRLIFAFDKEKGLEKMTINKEEDRTDLHEEIYEWEDTIPLKSIYQIRCEDGDNTIPLYANAYIQLYDMYDYNEQHIKGTDENKDTYNTYIMPEGITKIKRTDAYYHRKSGHISELFNYKYGKYILPSTLKKIEKGLFNMCDNIYEIEFNEGLEEIEDEAFTGCINLGRYKSLKCPTSLKKIGARAFYNCFDMCPLILNEGLTTIGDEAFNWNKDDFREFAYKPAVANIIFLPSSIKHVGNNIVDGIRVNNLGLKNYRGQQIPEQVWKIWYHGEGKEECTNLERIVLFKGDSMEPYMEIDPKKLIGIPNKSEALAKMCMPNQER